MANLCKRKRKTNKQTTYLNSKISQKFILLSRLAISRRSWHRQPSGRCSHAKSEHIVWDEMRAMETFSSRRYIHGNKFHPSICVSIAFHMSILIGNENLWSAREKRKERCGICSKVAPIFGKQGCYDFDVKSNIYYYWMPLRTHTYPTLSNLFSFCSRKGKW